jgi:hypothetical protein
MKRYLLRILYLLAILAIIFSCTKDNNLTNVINLPDGYIKLKEGYVFGASAKVEIWGNKELSTGYNKLIVVLYDSLNLNEIITDAHIHLMPVMTIGTGDSELQYGTPVENPDETAINGVFPGAVVFIMPSGSDGKWKLGVAVHNHVYDKEGETDFDINVIEPAVSCLCMFKSQSADSCDLVLSLVEPFTPKVGDNDIEFAIHRMIDVMDYVSDDSCTFEISPQMAGMGNSLTSIIPLVSAGNGHYKGKVNFNMTGSWQVNVILKKEGNIISKDPCFNFTVLK